MQRNLQLMNLCQSDDSDVVFTTAASIARYFARSVRNLHFYGTNLLEQAEVKICPHDWVFANNFIFITSLTYILHLYLSALIVITSQIQLLIDSIFIVHVA